jgi:phage head maturation protease
MVGLVSGIGVSRVGRWEPLSNDKQGLAGTMRSEGEGEGGREEAEEVARGNVKQRGQRMGSSVIYCGIDWETG